MHPYQWIVDEYFPKNYENMTYVEVFGGNGLVWWAKNSSKMEVYNDLDQTIHRIMRSCADPYTYQCLINILTYGTHIPFLGAEPCCSHDAIYKTAELVQILTPAIWDGTQHWEVCLEDLRASFEKAVLENKDPLELIEKHGKYDNTFILCWAPSDYDHVAIGNALFEVRTAKWLAVVRPQNACHYEGTKIEIPNAQLVLIK